MKGKTKDNYESMLKRNNVMSVTVYPETTVNILILVYPNKPNPTRNIMQESALKNTHYKIFERLFRLSLA